MDSKCGGSDRFHEIQINAQILNAEAPNIYDGIGPISFKVMNKLR